tara:strand:+ start:1079 stop:1189 length:111 start_codon:yes stop_codon:yes gene_type:complete
VDRELGESQEPAREPSLEEEEPWGGLTSCQVEMSGR